jgi:histidyl-tRNA synthetase
MGIAASAGIADRMMEMTIAIDKLDKIGEEGVMKELTERGFSADAIGVIQSMLGLKGDNREQLASLRQVLAANETGMKGIEEIEFVLDKIDTLPLASAKVELDITLARGLNYYTGAIFEVKAEGVQMGSICGGGRYDDLTGIFGLKGVSGVGISFGADRIYDVMNELNLFPDHAKQSTRVLFANFGPQEEQQCLQLVRQVRQAGINAEIYPENAKMKKQFKYADDKHIPYVAIVGEEELNSQTISLKHMQSGEQFKLTIHELIARIQD